MVGRKKSTVHAQVIVKDSNAGGASRRGNYSSRWLFSLFPLPLPNGPLFMKTDETRRRAGRRQK